MTTVVLLHGLARHSGSLRRLRRELERHGFATWARSYPSRRMPIADAAATVADWIATDLGSTELCAVTHSLGGILIRHMHDPRLRWRRIVMLAPPNQGSQVALAFRDHPMFRWFYGPAGQELADPTAWPAPPGPFAVIAGTRNDSLLNPATWLTRGRFAVAGESDGTVSVAETKHAAMSDFVTVNASHTFIMNHPEVVERVVEYLKEGRFGGGERGARERERRRWKRRSTAAGDGNGG